MKVAISQRVKDGPWGGGNNFVRSLIAGLEARGHDVSDQLSPATDLALVIDPRTRNPLQTFSPGQLLRHLARHPGTLVVHRINECDERKGTRSINLRLRVANYAADHTVFIASWLKDLRVWRGDGESSVILNGGDRALFNADANVPWDGVEPFRLVTHHWGASRLKGFDVYEMIDALLDDPAWKDRVAFTYVGNLPADVTFKNITVLPPLSGEKLASELQSHHAYLTASINEPAGMHHIEGALCGLPLIYRESGALPEYCTGFGEAFHGPDDARTAIERMMAGYAAQKTNITSYPHTAEKMVAQYVALFEDMISRRENYVGKRRLWRDPLAFGANQLPL